MPRLSHNDLNRATLSRQFLTGRVDAPVHEVIGRLAGLQAQHATWPYIALWTRRPTHNVSELEAAIADRSVVKATVMRSTLHLVDAQDLRAFDAMAAEHRLATWRPSAQRAGLDVIELNSAVRAFCHEPRTVVDIEAHLAGLHPGLDPHDHIPAGVRNAWFRLGSAGGGLVHVPPSGFWAEHGKPRYIDIDRWLDGPRPDPDDALQTGAERYLGAYGPATLADLMQWSGQRRRGRMNKAVAALGDRVVQLDGPDGQTYVDLADCDLPSDADADAPPRFLARWDSVLIAYNKAGRSRIIDPDRMRAVYKKNGDVLPTFLIDGMVAGLWSYDSDPDRGRTTLRIESFSPIGSSDRAALTDEAERLVRYIAPEAADHAVTWAS